VETARSRAPEQPVPSNVTVSISTADQPRRDLHMLVVPDLEPSSGRRPGSRLCGSRRWRRPLRLIPFDGGEISAA
jgi:hypothetical protein